MMTPQLEHRIVNQEVLHGLAPFLQVFFLVWWAWMNFTWFASSYDTDDVGYRLLTLVQMAGALVLAAGVPAALKNHDFLAITAGYLVMRVGLIALWSRAAVEDRASRATALRYAAGIAGVGVVWVLRLVTVESGALPEALLFPTFVGLVALELSLPLWLERTRRRRAGWHPHHIAERYGLFAILLLGEGILAASSSVQTAIARGGVSAELVTISISGLVLIFGLWWLYFLEPAGEGLARNPERAVLWGCFGQYGIFVSLAGLGAGLAVAVGQAGDRTPLSPVALSYAIAVPVAVFLVLQWAVSVPIVRCSAIRAPVVLVGVACTLLAPLAAMVTGIAVAVAMIATVCTSMIAVTILMDTRRRPTVTAAHDPVAGCTGAIAIEHVAPARPTLSRAGTARQERAGVGSPEGKRL